MSIAACHKMGKPNRGEKEAIQGREQHDGAHMTGGTAPYLSFEQTLEIKFQADGK